MNEFNEELCEANRKGITDRLDIHDNRLNDHSKRLNKIEQDSRGYQVEIKNLVKKMDDFINTIKWGLGIFVTLSLFVIGILLKK